jgi:uncharacterized protein (TIGR00156 family)
MFTSPRNLVAMPALALCASLAFAQYVGPSATPTYKTIAEVLKNPVDDAPVVLTGHIVKKLSKEKYTFTDLSGEIRIDVDQKLFPATPISEKTKVQIRGEVEKDFMHSPEIDADSLSIVDNPAP